MTANHAVLCRSTHAHEMLEILNQRHVMKFNGRRGILIVLVLAVRTISDDNHSCAMACQSLHDREMLEILAVLLVLAVRAVCDKSKSIHAPESLSMKQHVSINLQELVQDQIQLLPRRSVVRHNQRKRKSSDMGRAPTAPAATRTTSPAAAAAARSVPRLLAHLLSPQADRLREPSAMLGRHKVAKLGRNIFNLHGSEGTRWLLGKKGNRGGSIVDETSEQPHRQRGCARAVP